MPFGLKNDGDRAMRVCLGAQIGRNVKAYIDGIVVKTKHHVSLIRNLEETFNNVRKFNLKLNPEKCVC
jgi:hypothetical protein